MSIVEWDGVRRERSRRPADVRSILLLVRCSCGRIGRVAELSGVESAFDGVPAQPGPVVYLAALKLIGAAAGRAFLVEDPPTGVPAAHAAGITCVGLINAVHPGAALVEADRQVRSLDGLSAADTTPTPVGGVSCAC